MVLTKMTPRSISCEKSPGALIDRGEPLVIFYQIILLMSIPQVNSKGWGV